jgi:hypothetical protein
MSKRSDLNGDQTDNLAQSCFKYYYNQGRRFTTVNQPSQDSEEGDMGFTSISETTQLENPHQTNLTNFLNRTENNNFGNQSSSNSNMSLISNNTCPAKSDM